MWGLFFASVAVGALFLYVPGLLLARAVGAPRFAAFACAPLASIPVYIALTLAYSAADVFCTWYLLVGPALLLGVALWLAAFAARRRKGRARGWRATDFGIAPSSGKGVARFGAGYDAFCLVLYVALGVAVSAAYFLGALETPESFAQEYDNLHHLGVTLGYVEAGDWSPFASSLYATAEDAAVNPLPGSGFYPSAWNCLSALLSSALGVSAAFAGNAVNFLFVAVVLPASMFFFMRVAFASRPEAVPFAAPCVLAFPVFPWRLLVFGPLYPNMIAFCMVPAAAACFMVLVSAKAARGARIASGALFCLSIIAFAFAQPNAVFALGALLAPLCVYRAADLGASLPAFRSRRVLGRVLFGFAAFAAIAAAWLVLYKAPFLQSVVHHWWPSYQGVDDAIFGVATLVFRWEAPWAILAVLVILGALYTLHRREYLWMTCAYALMSFIYIVAASMDCALKPILAGFWYTDQVRISALVALFGIPLAALGLRLAARGIAACVGFLARRGSRCKAVAVPAACAACVAFFCLNYGWGGPVILEESPGSSASEVLAHDLKNIYGDEPPCVYDRDEKAFVERVKEMVPEDSLIINLPDDGSAFAYSTDGLRVYYRHLRVYGEGGETEDSVLIRTRLCDVASDAAVQQAVRNVGAEYLLLLDQGPETTPRRYLFTYEDGRRWPGLLAIDDDTPGFEPVLAEGDMRLYKIEAVA